MSLSIEVTMATVNFEVVCVCLKVMYRINNSLITKQPSIFSEMLSFCKIEKV